MSLPELAVRRPVATVTVLLVIVLIGLVSLSRTPLNLLPEIEPPVLAIITAYPGASPQETLSLITEPLERQVSDVGGLVNISSLSQEGLSMVLLRFRWGADINELREEVSTRLGLAGLPEGAERPLLLKFDPTVMPIMEIVAAAGTGPEELSRFLKNTVIPRLENIPGVARVNLTGHTDRDIFVYLNRREMQERGVSFQQVAQALHSGLQDLPAGAAVLDERSLRLRLLGRLPAAELPGLVVGAQLQTEKLAEAVRRAVKERLRSMPPAAAPARELPAPPLKPIYLEDLLQDSSLTLTLELDRLPWVRLGSNPLLQVFRNRFGGDTAQARIEIPLVDLLKTGGPREPLAYLPDPAAWSGQLEAALQEEIGAMAARWEEIMVEFSLAQATGGAPNLEPPAGSFLTPVYLADVAEIREDAPPPAALSRLNGRPALLLSIQKEGEANTVRVAREVKRVLREAEENSLPGLSFSYAFDQSQEIEGALRDLGYSLLGGAVLAVLVLFLFLRDYRTILIIALAIPAALLATCAFLYFSGLTLNLMTLGGLALATGLLVDNAIVVSENIFQHYQRGAAAPVAAVRGSEEVTGAIFASTLTTVCVFFPIVLLQGMAGQLFREFALTVTVALAASLLVALTLIPLLFSRLPHAAPTPAPARPSAYQRLLQGALARRRSLLLAAALTVALGLWLYPRLGTDLFPATGDPSFVIDLEMPPGTPLQATDAAVQKLEAILAGLEGVSAYTATVGQSTQFGLPVSAGASHQARLRVQLEQAYLDEMDTIMEKAREQLAAAVADSRLYFSRRSILESAGLEAELELYIEGENLEAVKEAAGQVMKRLEKVSAITNVRCALEENRPEIHISLNREAALQKGITGQQVALFLYNVLRGVPVARTGAAGEAKDVILGFAPGELSAVDDLHELILVSPAGESVPLREVAAIAEGWGPPAIPRENGRIVGQVKARYAGANLGSITRDALEAVEEFALPAGCRVYAAGVSNLLLEAFDELTTVLIISVALIYLVMAAQFESWLQPLVIIASLPLALSGAVIALLVTGQSFSVPAFIGAIVLAGILVNDGIIMVDCINRLHRRRGMSLEKAVLRGSAARLRPVLMTTLTTVFGLVPLALGLGTGGRLQAGMALTVMGGEISGTLLILFVIPVLYMLCYKQTKEK